MFNRSRIRKINPHDLWEWNELSMSQTYDLWLCSSNALQTEYRDTPKTPVLRCFDVYIARVLLQLGTKKKKNSVARKTKTKTTRKGKTKGKRRRKIQRLEMGSDFAEDEFSFIRRPSSERRTLGSASLEPTLSFNLFGNKYDLDAFEEPEEEEEKPKQPVVKR